MLYFLSNLFILVFLYFPIVKIYGRSFPISLIFLFVIFLDQKILLYQPVKTFIKYGFGSICLLSFITLISSTIFGLANLSNIFYLSIIFYQLLLFIITFYIFSFESLKKLLLIYLKSWLIINLIVAFLDLSGIDLLGFIKFYRDYSLSIHFVMDERFYLNYESLTNRSPGLVGNSAIFGLLSYLIAKTISNINRDKFYIWRIISFLCIILSGARTGIIAFLFIETLPLLRIILQFSYKSFYLLILSTISFFGISGFFSKTLIFRTLSEVSSGDIMTDYGILYRAQNYLMLFEKPIVTFLVGGFNRNSFEKFVDSEFVMRIMQFGFLGYLSFFILTYITIKFTSFSYAFPIVFISIFASLTMFFSTSLYFLPFITLFSVSLIYSNKKQNFNKISDDKILYSEI